MESKKLHFNILSHFHRKLTIASRRMRWGKFQGLLERSIAELVQTWNWSVSQHSQTYHNIYNMHQIKSRQKSKFWMCCRLIVTYKPVEYLNQFNFLKIIEHDWWFTIFVHWIKIYSTLVWKYSLTTHAHASILLDDQFQPEKLGNHFLSAKV